MKVLITSDWHLDHCSLGHARFDELQRAVHETVQTAIEEMCTHYFFLGDLCDPDRGVSVFQCVDVAIRAALILSKAGIESHWLAGNHDVIEDGSGTTTLTPMRGLMTLETAGCPIVVHEKPGHFELHEGWELLTLPFTSTSHTYDPETWVDIAGDNRKLIVIGHLSVPGVIPGEETHEMPRGRDVVFPRDAFRERTKETHLFNGHYHRQQVHNGVHIPGSLARLTFGEEKHEPGFLIGAF